MYSFHVLILTFTVTLPCSHTPLRPLVPSPPRPVVSSPPCSLTPSPGCFLAPLFPHSLAPLFPRPVVSLPSCSLTPSPSSPPGFLAPSPSLSCLLTHSTPCSLTHCPVSSLPRPLVPSPLPPFAPLFPRALPLFSHPSLPCSLTPLFSRPPAPLSLRVLAPVPSSPHPCSSPSHLIHRSLVKEELCPYCFFLRLLSIKESTTSITLSSETSGTYFLTFRLT